MQKSNILQTYFKYFFLYCNHNSIIFHVLRTIYDPQIIFLIPRLSINKIIRVGTDLPLYIHIYMRILFYHNLRTFVSIDCQDISTSLQIERIVVFRRRRCNVAAIKRID